MISVLTERISSKVLSLSAHTGKPMCGHMKKLTHTSQEISLETNWKDLSLGPTAPRTVGRFISFVLATQFNVIVFNDSLN